MANPTPVSAPPSFAPTPAMQAAEPLTLLDHWVDAQRPALTRDLKARLIPVAPGRDLALGPATQGKWTDAIRALRSFPEPFAIRGNEEADACEAELPKAAEAAQGPGAPPRPQAAGAPHIPGAPIIPGSPRPPGPRGGGGP